MAHSEKRKAEGDAFENHEAKRSKEKKSWTTPKRQEGGEPYAPARKQIEPGDSGIWATCNKGREGKCVAELKVLFQEYAEKLYPVEDSIAETPSTGVDVDAELKKELEEMRSKPIEQELFLSVRLDTPCVVFFKVTSPIEPTSFVHTICEDAAASTHRKQSRSVKRLTPITLCGKATETGLGEVAQKVLAPHFHQPGVKGKKFAIRTNFRNHSILKRDGVIKQVAKAVGPNHDVDLKAFDLLILVEVYQNICGMSVVPGDFDQLKKYNLAEIFEPTPLAQPTGDSVIVIERSPIIL
ncbi:THUMP domain-containing protein [Tothia fuscella]|uniref:THUMP domain-containing protein n=1 Tax=Tothia fuscella TaxID=1048955 RepID=A0A9P4TTG7_9PEZI|nr:THUMP domain-containing protein [Tothia fuscella]